MNILERIKSSVANQGQGVFLRAEFERFGSPAQVGAPCASSREVAPWCGSA